MSFQQGLSGLNATSKSLEVIGNNIANAGTYGSKASRAEFADMYASALGGGGASAIGIGTNLVAVAQQFTQGNITATENPMDIAINGSGFFQVSNGGGGPPMYSRNGQFKVDRSGFIVNNEGLRLLGYPEGSSLSTPQALQLPTAGVEARATTSMSMELRLNSSEGATNPAVLATRVRDDAVTRATASAAAAAADPGNTALAEQASLDADAVVAAETALTNAQAAAQIDFTDDDTYNFTTSMTVFDALGEPVPLSYYYQKTAKDTYDVYVTANGESISVDADGLPLPVTTVQFGGANGAGAPTAPAGAVAVDIPATINASGAQTQPIIGIEADFSGLGQAAGTENLTNVTQDGYAQGQLSSINIDANGTIMARYSNGQSRPAGVIELVNFRNPQGLQPRGNNTWVSTYASGTPIPGTPGVGNLGALQAGALEESNVDLTAELVSMITAQRNYQANAQTIKTVDAVMQTLVSLR